MMLAVEGYRMPADTAMSVLNVCCTLPRAVAFFLSTGIDLASCMSCILAIIHHAVILPTSHRELTWKM